MVEGEIYALQSAVFTPVYLGYVVLEMGDRLVHKGYSYNIRLGHERVLHKLERAEISDAVQASEIESTIGTFTVTIYVKFIVAQAVFLPVIVKLFSVNVEAGQPFVGTQPHTP